jgi:biopolymer transport protein ExbD
MPKLSMPKKSTNIDMTALCDFTLLLLTFFIMSSQFKPQEVVTVRTPSSTSTKEIPAGFIEITLDKTGRVFFAIDNYNLKRYTINEVNTTKGLGLSDAEISSFVTNGIVGLPFTKLKSYLAMTPEQQAATDKTVPGVPTDTTGSFTTNELAYWIQTTRMQAQINEMDAPRFVIKVDGDAPYTETQRVVSTLGKLQIFKFSFLTNSKAVPPGTALFEKQYGNKTATKPAQ